MERCPASACRLRIFKRRRAFDEALLIEILSASPGPGEPDMRAFRRVRRMLAAALVAGCAARGQTAPTSRQSGAHRPGEPRRVLEPVRGPAFGYRRRARLGVKYVHKKGRVLAGFREREKPYIAELRRCEILIGRFATLPADLAALVERLSIPR